MITEVRIKNISAFLHVERTLSRGFLLCVVQYQLQRSSPWRSVSFQWQTWLVLIMATVLMSLVPYAVYCMMTAFTSPPPPGTFKVAAIFFGILTETLLIK